MKKNWRDKELITKNLFKGELVPGSGCGFEKGDISIQACGAFVEVKSTVKDFIVLKSKWLEKLIKQAKLKEPILILYTKTEVICYLSCLTDITGTEEWNTVKIYNVHTAPILKLFNSKVEWIPTNIETVKSMLNDLRSTS